MTDRPQPDLARCSDCGWRHRADDLCIVDLEAPESLDAQLSEAERQECERVVRAETWRIGGGNPRRASDGAPLVAVLAGDADAIDAHCRFVCWTDPEDAARIVAAVNGDALRAVERGTGMNGIERMQADEEQDNLAEIALRHTPVLHGGEPCPVGVCCSCGAEDGCETGALIAILQQREARLRAVERERAALAEALSSVGRKLEVAHLGLDRNGPQYARITEARAIAQSALAASTARDGEQP